MAGGFNYVNGQLHTNLVRLTYSPYSGVTTGLPPIAGPDTVTSGSNSVMYSLPDSLGYVWSYSGANTSMVNNSQNPLALSFAANASSGILSAKGVGYCGTGNYSTQKNIVVIPSFSMPGINACCMQFSGLGPDRISLAFTPGNGSGRIVVASTYPALSTPVLGTAYAANTVFGSGADLGGGVFVIYSGAGDSLTVTGLQPSTRYYFTVYEYNGANKSINYLVSQAYTAYSSTVTPGPTVGPSGIRFSNIGMDSLTISCAPGNGTGRVFLLKAINPIRASPQNGNTYFGDPVFGYGNQLSDSSYFVADTGTVVHVQHLTPGTLYYANIFEYSGSSIFIDYDENDYLSDTVRTTAAAVSTPPVIDTAQNWQDSAFVVNIYPNPVYQNCFVQVQSNVSATMSVTVYDFSGNLVNVTFYKLQPGKNVFEFTRLASLPRGVYFLNWSAPGHKGGVKLFKE